MIESELWPQSKKKRVNTHRRANTIKVGGPMKWGEYVKKRKGG